MIKHPFHCIIINSSIHLYTPIFNSCSSLYLHHMKRSECAIIYCPPPEQRREGIKDQTSGKAKKSIVIGPWGGNGGINWDDGIYNGVREITIVYDHCIDSIQVVYDKNGKPIAAAKHGGVGGTKTAEIKLQYPEEILVSVSGHYCPVVRGGSPVIRSLTFKSNKRVFGLYGMEEGTPFTFSTDGGLVVGFKGRSGWYVDEIGFHLSHVQSTKLLQRVQKTFRRLASTASRSSMRKDGEEKPPKAYD